MLRPEYLEGLPDEILELFSEAEQEILADMARRISTYDFWIPAADHQNRVLREAGIMQEDILTVLSATTRKTEEELRDLMQRAGSMALHNDESIYSAGGLRVSSIKDSLPLRNVLNAGYQATATEMQNLCRTTARTATKQFEDALDRAWLNVSSGAFDADAAIRSAVKELSEKGIQSIRYPSGKTDSIEVAVRRAVVTGVNQTAGQLQIELADELGCDLVEVTAHSDARPEHALWQGRIYSRSGKHPNYPPFVASTGYGTGEGLCGWNCRHSFSPYISGSPRVWSDEELAKLDEPTVEYDGKKMTEYEARQRMRYNERQIRRWKREEVALNAAGLDSSEAASKVSAWQARQRDFFDQTGFKRQYGLEQISVANSNKHGIIETEMLHKSEQQERPFKPASDRRVSELTIWARKNGAVVIRGNEAGEKHLADMGATASTVGDVLLFRADACVSEVIEEAYHFYQNKTGMNDDKGEPLRTILNEIDAREYMLRNAKAFGIPRIECNHLSKQLANYIEQLKQLKGE